MDKIEKALTKLSKKERELVAALLRKIQAIDFVGLDFKKLKDRQDVFRVRRGDVRIIFRVVKDGSVFILAVERRSDTTYHAF